MIPAPKILAEFGVSAPELVEETGLAVLWKVCRADGSPAVLKIYGSKGMRNESEGFRFLAAAGGPAARVYKVTASAALIEWLSGPPLGDLSRAGRDAEAAAELVQVAKGLHASAIPEAGYPRLEDWFRALFSLTVSAGASEAARRNIFRSQVLARRLLADPQDVRPLHGDLHHSNIRLGDRGYCAFDAKGVLGERAYELANAFRHPRGAPDLVREPERIRFLATLWSQEFQVGQRRLMQWAAAKCALSIAWRNGGRLGKDPELDLLGALLNAAEG